MINGFEFRNAIRGQKGFTLVEVIVVAIIVAALAAVAIPLYNSYVTTSRNNAAANAAGSVASFLGACKNQAGAYTGITAATATAGPVTIVCKYGTASPQDSTTIAVPAGITVTVSTLAASPGTVTATSGGGAAQTYNF
jgi:type IV pilus assembly protein PilA